MNNQDLPGFPLHSAARKSSKFVANRSDLLTIAVFLIVSFGILMLVLLAEIEEEDENSEFKAYLKWLTIVLTVVSPFCGFFWLKAELNALVQTVVILVFCLAPPLLIAIFYIFGALSPELGVTFGS